MTKTNGDLSIYFTFILVKLVGTSSYLDIVFLAELRDSTQLIPETARTIPTSDVGRPKPSTSRGLTHHNEKTCFKDPLSAI